MRINAPNAHEASKQILRTIIATDYRQSGHKSNPYGYTFVYFDPERCRFYFECTQWRNPATLLKRYKVLDYEDIIEVAACKHTFSQVACGAVISRKMFSPIDYFQMIKNNFEWA